MQDRSPWWSPEVHMDRRPLLLARGRIKAGVRRYFESDGFTEVETACLQVSPGNETHLNAFKTVLVGTDLARTSLYLHTSPEFAAKKLLAAGETAIFTFAPVFRNRERGALHHPEFTMLEWYRVGDTYEHVMGDCAALVERAASAVENRFFSYLGRTCDSRAKADRISVAEAFSRHSGIDLLATISASGADRDALAGKAEAAGIKVAGDDTWSDIFSRVLTALIEPKLGIGRPTLLLDYPASEAALARVSPRDARIAERFELYICGVEIANGFGELTDAVEQRRRFEAQMSERERIYGERYPIDEEFLAALEIMPPAAGVALGFDRLVMLATGAQRIEQVIWTPVAE